MVWQRAEQHSVDCAEDYGIGAKSKGHGKHNGQQKSRLFCQDPQAEAEVLKEISHVEYTEYTCGAESWCCLRQGQLDNL